MIALNFSSLMLNDSVVGMVTNFKVLGAVLDRKQSLESYVRLIAASASSKPVIMRKVIWLFGNPVIVF